MNYDFTDDYCARARRARRRNEFIDFALLIGVCACLVIAYVVARS